MLFFNRISTVAVILFCLCAGVCVFASPATSVKITTVGRDGLLKTATGQRFVFAGVDLVSAPEVYEFRQKSLAHIRSLVKGQEVFIRVDPTSRGKAGAKAVYVFFTQNAEQSLNLMLIKTGWVEAAYGRPYQKTSEFLNAQSKAAEKKLGIWKYKKTTAASMGVNSVNRMGKAQKILSAIN